MNERCVIHIIDDDPAMSKLLRTVMASARVPAQVYGSAEEYLRDLPSPELGCLVLDLRMPGMGGMELLRRLRAVGHQMPVIVMSAGVDVPTAVQAMRMGAVDVMQKPVEPSRLLEAVQIAADRSVKLHAERIDKQALRARMADLTSRESELLKLVVAGMSNKQMAGEMGISVKTVANHRASLMAKTRALNAADLARMSMTAGMSRAA